MVKVDNTRMIIPYRHYYSSSMDAIIKITGRLMPPKQFSIELAGYAYIVVNRFTPSPWYMKGLEENTGAFALDSLFYEELKLLPKGMRVRKMTKERYIAWLL